MKILIDTHIFLFLVAEPKNIERKRLKTLEDISNEVFLSSVSIAELMIKESIGKIKIEFDPTEIAQESEIKLLNFLPEEALLLKSLPMHHKDPFDRMLICQAIHNDFYIMTDDEKFRQYSCKII